MGFGVNQIYVPVNRDPARLAILLEEFISVIDGDMPAAGSECHGCNYIDGRAALEI
jgi:hypothetical protein